MFKTYYLFCKFSENNPPSLQGLKKKVTASKRVKCKVNSYLIDPKMSKSLLIHPDIYIPIFTHLAFCNHSSYYHISLPYHHNRVVANFTLLRENIGWWKTISFYNYHFIDLYIMLECTIVRTAVLQQNENL